MSIIRTIGWCGLVSVATLCVVLAQEKKADKPAAFRKRVARSEGSAVRHWQDTSLIQRLSLKGDGAGNCTTAACAIAATTGREKNSERRKEPGRAAELAQDTSSDL